MSAIQYHIRRIAMARRAVKELTALAEQRAAAAKKRRGGVRFRPLTKSETEAIVGTELLAALSRGCGRAAR